MNKEFQKTICRFGENVCTLRTQKGFSQLALAEKLDTSVMTISRIENGHVVTDIKMLLRIAALFDISVEKLLFEDLRSF